MPGLDRTGPIGRGAMTGRGLGPCGARLRGRDFARGGGFGRGFGRFAFADPYTDPLVLNRTDQKKVLSEEIRALEAELKQLKDALKEISK